MEKELFFCSNASIDFGESLAATASNNNGFILLEHAAPFPEKIVHAHFNPEWLAKVQDLAKRTGFKVLLVRNKHTTSAACRITYVDCLRGIYFQLEANIAHLHEINLEEHINAPGTKWEQTPFFVICTNGNKDKCCAKWGHPVYKHIEQKSPGTPVWECTHLGGDRFAANIVLLPYGIYYGRVRTDTAPVIIKKSAQGIIHMPNYRGISRYKAPEQAAEFYLRKHTGHYDISFEWKITAAQKEGDLYSFTIEAAGYGRFAITLIKRLIDYPYLVSCKAEAPEPITKYELYRLAAVTKN